MSTAVAPERQVGKWTPPLDADALRLVLARMTAWKPFDVEEIFNDLDTAIGDQPPPADTTAALVERLRSHLKQLSDIAVADAQYPPNGEMVALIELGLPMRAEPTPAEHQHVVGLARRLAFVISDLVEKLIDARYIQGAE